MMSTLTARCTMSLVRSALLSLSFAVGLQFSAAGAVAENSAPNNPDTASSAPLASAGSAFKKVGEGRLKVMFWQVYDARLYTPSGDYQPGARPLKLEIEYLRDVKSKALAERTLKEWEAMDRDHPRQAEWAASLEELWPDIQTNDVLSLELDKEQVATFRRNGEYLGRIDDPEFGQQFVDIWLSEDSTQPELRLTLLGRKG